MREWNKKEKSWDTGSKKSNSRAGQKDPQDHDGERSKDSSCPGGTENDISQCSRSEGSRSDISKKRNQ